MKILQRMCVCVFATVLLVSCAATSTGDKGDVANKELVSEAVQNTTLTVALYPYVPRIDQFQEAIVAAWSAQQPNVTLNFVPANQWDGGYSSDPQPNYDVFIFDGMFYEYFKAQGYLLPMSPAQVDNASDFLAYARDGVTDKNGDYYALPFLGCSNVLFYEKSNTALANANTLSQVTAALGQYTYTSQEPPDRRGLMIDMSGGTTNAALYLDIAHSLTGVYPLPLPAVPALLNPKAVQNMTEIISLASYWNVTRDVAEPYERAEWFSDGYGKAMVGFTEAMSNMSAATRANIGFKVMPVSDTTTNPNLFYADVIGVNSKSAQQALAIQLANVIASSTTFVASTGATTVNGQQLSPQYLMATRASAFSALAKQDPIYKNMYALITNNNPLMFKLDSNARTWLGNMKTPIKDAARKPYVGGCDYPASSIIGSSAQAAAYCTAACASNGGWNSQWTNEYPAAPDGTSACGCNSCPVPN